MARRRNAVATALDGAIAGAAATWLMGAITNYLYAREGTRAREREDSSRHGTTAYEVAAEKIARVAGRSLSDEQRQSYGMRIHWALGVGTGAAYALLRNRSRAVAAARGLLFGTAFFLLIDEGLVYALGLTPGPRHFPWQTHARGLAGHLAYSAATDGALSLLEGRA